MKRNRSGYNDSSEVRLEKVFNFISHLKLTIPLHRLHQQRERHDCSKCGKKRLFFCYDCLTVTHPDTHPPSLPLPLNVYVLFHPGELRSKSTSLAAATISPDIHVIEYPEVPSALLPDNTLLLYPSEDSVDLMEIDNLEQYKNVVFVESTWQKSKGVANDKRVTAFKHVRIPSQTTLFWRFQNNDPTHLATVEAIYFFLRTYVARKALLAQKGDKEPTKLSEEELLAKYYKGEVDDLLFYYIYQYISVQRRYKDGEQYTTRHFDGYIMKDGSWDSLLTSPEKIQCPPGSE